MSDLGKLRRGLKYNWILNHTVGKEKEKFRKELNESPSMLTDLEHYMKSLKPATPPKVEKPKKDKEKKK